MAVYFQLTPIGYTEPATFQSVDDAICQNLGLEWDEKNYVNCWYDYIGIRLALGRTHQQITDELREQQRSDWCLTMIRINHFLLENYKVDAWFAR